MIEQSMPDQKILQLFTIKEVVPELPSPLIFTSTEEYDFKLRQQNDGSTWSDQLKLERVHQQE